MSSIFYASASTRDLIGIEKVHGTRFNPQMPLTCTSIVRSPIVEIFQQRQFLFGKTASLYNAIPLYRDPFSPNNSRKIPIARPLEARYGCFSWVPSLTKVLLSNLLCCVHYRFILDRDILTVYNIGPGPQPGPCITNVIATCRKNFSQWESSFLWKLRCHWLKFLRRVAKTLVIQGPAGITLLTEIS